MFLGIIYGLLASNAGLASFTSDWIAPFATIFINLLKVLAFPVALHKALIRPSVVWSGVAFAVMAEHAIA